MIGYREIIAVAVFIAVAVIIILWLIVKKAREKKIEEIKDRKLRGEDVEKEKDSLVRNWFKNGNIKSFFPIITPILAYIAVLVSFSILLPDLWQKYWIRQEFFWISQVYLVAMVMLGRLEGFWLKWMPRIVFSVILFAYIQKEWPKPEETTGDVVAETAVRPLSNILDVVAPTNKWSAKIHSKEGFQMWVNQNPTLGQKNIDSLMAIRLNEDDKFVSFQGYDKDGNVFSSKLVEGGNVPHTDFIQLKSMVGYEVYAQVGFNKN